MICYCRKVPCECAAAHYSFTPDYIPPDTGRAKAVKVGKRIAEADRICRALAEFAPGYLHETIDVCVLCDGHGAVGGEIEHAPNCLHVLARAYVEASK